MPRGGSSESSSHRKSGSRSFKDRRASIACQRCRHLKKSVCHSRLSYPTLLIPMTSVQTNGTREMWTLRSDWPSLRLHGCCSWPDGTTTTWLSSTHRTTRFTYSCKTGSFCCPSASVGRLTFSYCRLHQIHLHQLSRYIKTSLHLTNRMESNLPLTSLVFATISTTLFCEIVPWQMQTRKAWGFRCLRHHRATSNPRTSSLLMPSQDPISTPYTHISIMASTITLHHRIRLCRVRPDLCKTAYHTRKTLPIFPLK